MKPIAIAFKDYEVNPFTDRGGGELMIVHLCLNCGKLSPNRIAGDDSEYQIICVLKESLCLNEDIAMKLENMELELITNKNKEEALISLMGINYKNHIGNIEGLS